MSKQEALDLLMLLSALESWSFADKHNLPDYLQDKLADAIVMLSSHVLEADE